jgi:hypothetical protein
MHLGSSLMCENCAVSDREAKWELSCGLQDRAVMFGSCGELTLRVICCLAGGSSGMAGEGLSSAVRVTGTTLPPQTQRPL